MKEILKKIIIKIITLESRLVLWRFRPKIITISGSVGKTSTKDAIHSALSNILSVRKNQKSLNSEFGVPLTILGLETAWSSALGWIRNIFLGFITIFSFKKYPKWLVLEVGSDHPGDIPQIAKWLKPDIVVLTSFPEVPVHSEFFASPKDVNEEDRKIVLYMKKGSVLILNRDDPEVMKTKDLAKRVTYTFGEDSDADVYFSNQEIKYTEIDGLKMPTGLSIKVNYDGNCLPLNLQGVLGIQHIYPIVAALTVGLSQNLSIIDMLKSLEGHRPPKGRMNIISGVNNSVIIDDTYNSSPIAVWRALDTLEEIECSGKKIAVLGDMLELGRHSNSEHRRIGELVVENDLDFVFCVGKHSEETYMTASEKMGKERVFYFENYEGVASKLKELIQSGDVVLLKGSQSIRLEKVVKEIMNNPNEAKDLLVRQENFWVK